MSSDLKVSTQAITADADGIAQSQTPAGAGDLTLNGAGVFADDGSASFAIGKVPLDPARRITITSGGDVSNRTFTVYGYDQANKLITDVITGPNATTVTGLKRFRFVTRVAISGAAAAAVTVGWGAEHISNWIFLGHKRGNYTAGYSIQVTGTVNYDLERTFRNILRDQIEGEYDDSVDDIVTAQTTSQEAALSPLPEAIRLVQNSGSGSIIMRVIPSISG